MEIGTYADGRAVTYDDATHTFCIANIATTAELLIRYDNAGQISWASDSLRAWVHEYASGAAAAQAASAAPAASQAEAYAVGAPAMTSSAAVGVAAVPAPAYAGGGLGSGYDVPSYTERYGITANQSRVTPSSTNVVGRRYLAFFIDSMIAWTAAVMVMFALEIVVTLASAGKGSTLLGTRLLLQLVAYVVVFGYFIGGESHWGTTPAKRLFGLRVLTAGGDRIGFVQALLRNVLLMVDLLVFTLPAFISMRSSDIHQRLGDRAAGTAVVLERY